MAALARGQLPLRNFALSKIPKRTLLKDPLGFCGVSRKTQITNGPGSMKTETLEIKYPAGFEQAVHMTKEELEQHIRLMAALKMFELGKVSGGKAAELAGLSRLAFYEVCGRYRVSVFNYLPEELEQEVQRDLETLRKLEDT